MYMDPLTLTWNLQVAESRILKQSCVRDVWQDSELCRCLCICKYLLKRRQWCVQTEQKWVKTDFGDCNYTNSLPCQGHFTTRYCRCHSYGPPSCPHSLQMTCSGDTMRTNRASSTGIQKFYSITTKWMKHFVFSTVSKMLPFSFIITLTHNTPIYTLQWSGDRPCSTVPFLDVLINNTDPHLTLTSVYLSFPGLLSSCYLGFSPFS